MGTSRAIHALLDGAIDYAGLFPPAALSMSDAVASFARYRHGGDAWALGRFVVPVARLAEFTAAAAPYWQGGDVWRLSVLAGAADAAVIGAFNAEHLRMAVIDTVEAKATTVDEVAALTVLQGVECTVYVEVPLGAAHSALIPAIKAAGLRAKIRTGGVTADAFPPAADVVRFLADCAAAGVACKATAGLHHPVRGEYRLTYAPDSAAGTMYGFLNVFTAAMLIVHGLPSADAVALLEERDPAAFTISDDGIRWRSWHLPAEQIRNARAGSATSFGSCSFEEPLADLRTLAFL